MANERQKKEHGHSLDIFLGGIGPGVFAVAFLLFSVGSLQTMALIGMLVGSLLTIPALFFLLRRRSSSNAVFSAPASLSISFSRLILIQGLFIVFGLIFALPAFWMPLWLDTFLSKIFGIMAVILALLASVYQGFYLGKRNLVSLYPSCLLPVVSFLTAICTGVGLTLLILLNYFAGYPEEEVGIASGILGIIGIIFIIGNLIVMRSLLNRGAGSEQSESVKEAIRDIVTSAIFFIISLLLLFAGLWIGAMVYLVWISAVTGLLLVYGGYYFGVSIIKAGFDVPVAPIRQK